jgi:hypothetical protein
MKDQAYPNPSPVYHISYKAKATQAVVAFLWFLCVHCINVTLHSSCTFSKMAAFHKQNKFACKKISVIFNDQGKQMNKYNAV